MSSHQRHHDKERMREMAQRERANKANTSTPESAVPLFDKPSKVQSNSDGDDAISAIIRVLGPWEPSVIKSMGGNKNQLIGVVPSPATPQPDSNGSKKEFLFKQPSKANNGAFRSGEYKSTHESSRRSQEGSSSKSASTSVPDSKGGESKSTHGSKRDDTKPGYDNKRSRDHSADSSGKSSSEHRGHHSNHHRNRMPSDGSGGSEGGGGGGSRRSHSSERSSHSKHSSNTHARSSATISQQSSLNNSQSPTKPTFQSVPSPLSSQNKHQHHSRHSTSPSSSQATTKTHQSSNPIVSSPRKSPSSANSKSMFQHPTLKASSGSCNNSPATNTQVSLLAPRESTPPNGIYNRGILAKQHKSKLPNLLMPSCENNKSSSVGFEGLHDIFKEMKNIPAPVSEINTPRKSEEKLLFPLPPKPEKEITAATTEVKSTAKPDEEEKKSQVSSLVHSENSLENDLDISDDSETELGSTDIPSNITPSVVATKKREMEVEASGMSSGSDSSSEGSDSSSDSDGETSSSEDEGGKEADKPEVKKEEEQSVTPKETPSWGLGNFLKQLKQSSPEAPLPKKSSEKQKEIDETNNEMLDEIFHITSQHSLKDIGHTSSLPFSTDHLDPDFESERHQNGADSGCDMPSNNDRTNTSMGSFGSPDTASTCSSTSSKPSSGKPEKKGRGRPTLSSVSESVHRTSKGSDVSSSLSKSNSSGASKSKSTPKKDSKKEKSKSSHDEKKRRKMDFKSKPTISDSDDSEIDVVSVTPDSKANAPMANSIFDEDKDRVRSKLFSSPKANKSSPLKMSQEKESKSVSKDKEVKHKTSSHRKKDRDRDKDKSDNSLERSKKKDHKKVLSPLTVTDSKMDVDSEKHVDDIIQTTNEFKPPSLLSPFSSPTKTHFPSLSPLPHAVSPTCPRLTFSNGKPAIVVEINLSLLDRIPSSANSQSASPPAIVKSENRSSDVTETDKKNASTGAKTNDLSHKNADINPKSADVTPKSADKLIRTVDSTEKKLDTSDKSAKVLEKIARSVDKSAKNVDNSANSLDKSSGNTEKSANSMDKNAGVLMECKEEDISVDLKESECPVPVMQDKASRSHKRKGDSDRHDSGSSTSSKRHKSSSKSSKKSSAESLHNGSGGQSESKEGESIKVHTGERRSSTSSTSSRHSTTSSSKSKKTKVEDKVKREPPSPDKHIHKEKNDISHQNGQDHLPFMSYNDGQGAVKSEVVENGPQFAHIGQYKEERLESAEKYLYKAKELKHLADKDKPAKFSLYVKSVLSFVQCGCAMEKEAISEPQKIFTMYHDTLQLLKQVIRVRGTCIDMPITDKRLSVLLLRIQSLLCLKLYNLKRSEVMKFKKIIDADNSKTSSAKSPHQTTIYSRSIGTPPPISPTPSPAGSIGSVGSQGSCELPSSKLTNGNLSSNTTPMSSPGTVSVSQRIHSVTQQYIHLTGYLVTCQDLWLQADVAAQEFKEFFDMLDNTCGPLSLHSSVLHLVRYVNEGLQTLKDT